METSDFSQTAQMNQALAEAYYHQLQKMAKTLGIDESRTDYVSLLARYADVFRSPDAILTEGEWDTLFGHLQLALDAVIIFRKEEGTVLKNELANRIGLIEKLLAKVETLEPERMPRIRERILKELSGFTNDLSFDKNRFEQKCSIGSKRLTLPKKK